MKIKYRGSGSFAMTLTPNGLISVRFIYRCKDGYVVHWPGGGAQAGIVNSTIRLVKWANEEGMCLEIKNIDWANVDNQTITQELVDYLTGLIGDFFLTKTKAELLERAVRESMLIAPVATVADILSSPQLAARDYWDEVEHREIGEMVKFPGAPVKMAGIPWRVRRRAPLLGEHNLEIIGGELRYTREQFVLLKSRGVI